MVPPVTLITGSSRGIGRYLVEHYLRLGHKVLGCSRSETDLVQDRYEHFCVDVTDEKGVKGVFGSIRRRYGGLDHLVNNAGIAQMNHSMLTPLSSLHEVMATNFAGAFLFSREAAKLMRRRSNGRIVNVSSVAVPLRLEGEAVYAASKAAVEVLTRVMARELADYKITVNAVGPTPISTALIANVPKAKLEGIVGRQAIARMGTPADVANVVDFFLREESCFVTGQILYLGGV